MCVCFLFSFSRFFLSLSLSLSLSFLLSHTQGPSSETTAGGIARLIVESIEDGQEIREGGMDHHHQHHRTQPIFQEHQVSSSSSSSAAAPNAVITGHIPDAKAQKVYASVRLRHEKLYAVMRSFASS